MNEAKIEQRVKEYGTEVKERRKELGYTIQEMADKIGICVSYMYYIENGNNSPSFHIVLRIKEILGVEP